MTLRHDPDCTLCKLHKTTSNVCILGQGPEPCEVMIIGEAPGRNEEREGKPFVGKAGELLREILEDFDIDPSKVFIANAVSCRPPENRKPSKGEVKACNAWLKYQMSKVKPRFVLLLGATAYQSITGSSGVTKARGQPFEQDGVIYLPTLHPASALYDPNNEPLIRADIKLFSEILEDGNIPREKELDWKFVETWEDFDELMDALENEVSMDIEGTCLYPWQTHDEKGEKHPALITQIGFGTERGEFIIPTPHGPLRCWRDRDIRKMLRLITERLKKCFLIMHNGKFDCLWIWVHYQEQWHHLLDFDTMMAHYNLDENSLHGLKELARKYCGAPNWDIDKKSKQGNSTPEKLGLYHAHDLYYTRQLYFILNKMLLKEKDTLRLFYKFTLPAIKLYTEIQYDGVYINIDKFDNAEKYLIEEKRRAEKALKKYGDINWGSTKQLAQLLFKELKIPVVETTKKGSPSTSESVLKRIDHPAAGEILKFRAAKQQLSFFIEGWKPFLHKVEGTHTAYYLHPSFKLHGTVTGRPSCEDPNLQQVPRDPRIRSLVDAPPGWVLMEFDLEQIELKLVAEDSQDIMMMYAFRNGVDIHWLTMIREFERSGAQPDLVLDTVRTYKQDKKIRYAEALEILLDMGPEIATEINPIWKEMRKKAKAVNFGYVYGMWWKKFKMYARDNYDVIVTDEEAQDSRESFFETYKLEAWQKRKKRIAARKGYVCTWTGRRRRLPDASLKGSSEYVKAKRSSAERQAVNSPIQGFAAEINIMAAIQVRKEFSRDIVRVVGTIHDAILMWVKKGNEEKVATRVLKIMQRPELFDEFDIQLDVPITADCKIGPWSEGISLKKWKEQNNGEHKHVNHGSRHTVHRKAEQRVQRTRQTRGSLRKTQ